MEAALGCHWRLARQGVARAGKLPVARDTQLLIQTPRASQVHARDR